MTDKKKDPIFDKSNQTKKEPETDKDTIGESSEKKAKRGADEIAERLTGKPPKEK